MKHGECYCVVLNIQVFVIMFCLLYVQKIPNDD